MRKCIWDCGGGKKVNPYNLKSTWNPDENSLKECKEFGKKIAKNTKI